MRKLAIVASIAAIISVLVPASAYAIGGEGETWPALTESSGCGAQRIPTPHAEGTGWLSRDDLLRGDVAALFGRTVQDVHSSLVRWQIPGSSEVLAIHPLMIPALETAEAKLLSAMAADLEYRIDPASTFSTASRTIGGSIRTSRHTYGIAFDVNASKNPFRSDNRLITNLPTWWTQSFLDAGFCWGGLWIGSKDTMHFAWQGPAFSEYTELPLPYPPLTTAENLRLVRSIAVVPKASPGTINTSLIDADGNGAMDVVCVRALGPDEVIEYSAASWNHNACSSRTSVAGGLGGVARDATAIGFGDWDGRGGQDLWILTEESGVLNLTVRWAFGGFAAETTALTSVPIPAPDAWISTADMDVDGDLDLFVVEGSRLTVWDVDPNTGDSALLLRATLPFVGPSTLALGDFDLDNRPDLWSVTDAKVEIALSATSYSRVSHAQTPASLSLPIVDAVAADYDGDGRRDLITFDGTRKRVWLGNSPLPDGLPLEVWFSAEDPTCDDPEPQRSRTDREELRFATSGWVATGSFEWRSRHGFAVGCDPEDEACEPTVSTHRAFAEFLAWIDDLDPAQGTSETAAAVALDAAGHVNSCEIRDLECWDSPLLTTEFSSRFGQFLAERRDDGVNPHRWVPATVRQASTAILRW
ncbi:MAG: M15 family metallopeptidase [Actinomycetota bacterium]|nr:M15 family metallopeptidase [Actinomycetota bacterium]